MRPKLNADTAYISVSEGLYLHNNRTGVTLEGAHVARWMETLAPYLDGSSTLDELVEGLDPERSTMVRELIEVLLTHGFVSDISRDVPPRHLSADEQEIYAEEIAFISSFQDSAAYRFERVRDLRLVIIGSGQLVEYIARAGLASGSRQVAVLLTSECETSLQLHSSAIEHEARRDPAQTLIHVTPPAWDDEAGVRAALAPFDLVVYASDKPMLDRILHLNRACLSGGKTFLPAVLLSDVAWVGPVVTADTPGCWECAWRRLQSAVSPASSQQRDYDMANHPDAQVSSLLSTSIASIIANQMLFEVFKLVTEAGPVETSGGMIELDLENLNSQRRRFLPHPLCGACGNPQPRTREEYHASVRQLQQRDPIDHATFLKEVAACFDERLGLFTAIGEGDLVQLPLPVTQVMISNPMQVTAGQPPLIVTGTGVGLQIPRQRATQRACEIYCANVVDHRRLIHSDPTTGFAGESKASVSDIYAGAFMGSGVEGNQLAHEWTWAYFPLNDDVRLIPASLAFPSLAPASAPMEALQRMSGVGSGMSWSEALFHGLLAVCSELTVERLAESTQPYPLVDFSATALEPEGTRQRHLLSLASAELVAYDVTGPLGVPSFAITGDDQVLMYSTDTSVARALRNGLEAALLHYQAVKAEQLMYDLPPVPQLPMELRGTQLTIPASSAPEDATPGIQWILRRLHDRGWETAVVLLDHDAALHNVLPYIVRVLPFQIPA